MAETSTFGILHGRNVRDQNVLAEMSVAEISYIRTSLDNLLACIFYFLVKLKQKKSGNTVFATVDGEDVQSQFSQVMGNYKENALLGIISL